MLQGESARHRLTQADPSPHRLSPFLPFLSLQLTASLYDFHPRILVLFRVLLPGFTNTMSFILHSTPASYVYWGTLRAGAGNKKLNNKYIKRLRVV